MVRASRQAWSHHVLATTARLEAGGVVPVSIAVLEALVASAATAEQVLTVVKVRQHADLSAAL